MSLCRKLRAALGEGHTCRTTFPKTGSKIFRHAENKLAGRRVSLASLTNKKNHFLSGCAGKRDPASASRWNIGSVRETLMQTSLRNSDKATRISAARAYADLSIEFDLEGLSVFLPSMGKI